MAHPDDRVYESLIPDYGRTGTLKCEIEGDELVIRIRADTLAFAASHLDNGEIDEEHLKVADPATLLRDVAKELCRDDEGGGNMIEQMFDSAIVAAAEDGSQAFADPDPRDHIDLDAPELLEDERDGIHPS